ncbi:uncharacterized protein LOC143538786 [Bidens hawaiensis]|uniref:uncharacterized protein LOC143538786 n=1 Tax=Bidens hawaiensis TaxID=980011 RepID=UPI00404A3EAF
MVLNILSSLILVNQSRRLVEVFPDHMRKEYNKWLLRTLVLVSLAVQISLIYSGNRRKYIAMRRIRGFIWCAYLLADWVATVALGLLVDCQGNLGSSGSSNKEYGDLILMAFWAPFLLLHLGGPDTITAYALADNELWLRHFLGLCVQTFAACYITLLAWEGGLISWLTIPMLLCGMIKYGERTWVLMTANRDQFRDSVLTDTDPGPNYANFMKEYCLKEAEGYDVSAAQVEEQRSPEYDPENTTGASRDSKLDPRIILQRQVIEVELGFAYDVFYTKAPIIYTPFGLCFRLMTSCSTLAVLLTFSGLIGVNSHKHQLLDVAITYTLLIGALFLEAYAVRSLLLSDWTSLWSIRNSSKIVGRLIREKSIDTELDLKILFTCRGALSLQKHSKYGVFKWTVDVEFDHSILIWHIATDLCYNLNEIERRRRPDLHVNENEWNHYQKFSKKLADYMLYLLVMCPFMLPMGIGIIRFRDTCAEALVFFKERSGTNKDDAYEMLRHVDTKVFPKTVKGDRSKSVLFEACKLAASLNEMGRAEGRAKMWKMVGDVWVEILGYAASQCRGFDHAQQLEKGGELLTHVWLLMAHLGITEHFQINEGHGRVSWL